MNTSRFVKPFKHCLKLMCLGMLIGGTVSPPSLIQAKSKLAVPLPNTDSPQVFFECTPIRVLNNLGSITIECSTNDNGISFFSYPTQSGDTDFRNRSFRIMLTAFALTKKLQIAYDPNSTSGTPYGCLITNCREFVAIYIK